MERLSSGEFERWGHTVVSALNAYYPSKLKGLTLFTEMVDNFVDKSVCVALKPASTGRCLKKFII
jgi:hypothetical protein